MSRSKQLVLYSLMLRHWLGMIGNRSYWHGPQGLGTQFVPGFLGGYFNDLTNKVSWSGPVDSDGLLLNRLPSGELVYFPTALFQKALGHWDLWLGSDSTSQEHGEGFLGSARWALQHQDANGGWTAWPQLGLHYESPYSALTQGQGVSLLVRAWRMTGDDLFLGGARDALNLLLTPVTQQGLMRMVSEGLVLEEVSTGKGTTILNGWVFGLFGLYDYCLACDDANIEQMAHQSVTTLCKWLPRFDAGFWSYYDTGGTIASPFYHQLHIAQLEALEMAFPDCSSDLSAARHRFEWQASSRIRRLRAITCKATQKLKNPPDTILR